MEIKKIPFNSVPTKAVLGSTMTLKKFDLERIFQANTGIKYLATWQICFTRIAERFFLKLIK